MSERVKRTTLVFGSVLLLVVGGLWLFWPKPLPPPNESRRLHHPAGYSMVVPESFTGSVNIIGDETFADLIRLEDARYSAFPPALMAKRFRGEPDFEALSNRGFKQSGVFLGKEARIMNGPTGRGKAQLWTYRLVAQFGDQWFEISAADPQYFVFEGHPYAKYLETFRLDVPAPATVPSVRPVVPATIGGS